MRIITSILIVVFIWLCSCSSNNVSAVDKLEDSTHQKTDSTALLLSKFETVEPHDIHIYSTGLESKTYKFKGEKIDPRFYYLFRQDRNPANPFKDSNSNIFACFKLKLSNEKEGLILRRPSQYEESAIDLYSWNKSNNKLAFVENLTDAFGDAGWYFVQDAWIKDINGDNFLDIIKRYKEIDEDLDNPENINRKDSLTVLLGNGKEFKKNNKVTTDTTDFPLSHWLEQ